MRLAGIKVGDIVTVEGTMHCWVTAVHSGRLTVRPMGRSALASRTIRARQVTDHWRKMHH